VRGHGRPRAGQRRRPYPSDARHERSGLARQGANAHPPWAKHR
jgi:hypothetical protein